MLASVGLLTFALLGAAQSLYGPLLPALEREFSVRTTAAGLVFAAHGFGSLLGILMPAFLRLPTLAERWLSAASALLALGAAAFALATDWVAALASVFVLALGVGIHVERLNNLFVKRFGPRGMRMSQLLNAAFSVGAILGPLAVGLARGSHRALYGTAAALALALLPLCWLTDRATRGDSTPSTAQHADPPRARTEPRARRVLLGFVILMCLAVGAENCIGGWMTTIALGADYSFALAANLTALFYGAIFVGRLIAAGCAARLRAANLALAGVAALVALAALASLSAFAPVVLALAGFAIAPFFSATLVWLAQALPANRSAGSLVIAGAILGNAVFPALLGRIVDQFGTHAAPWSILCLAAAALAVGFALRRASP